MGGAIAPITGNEPRYLRYGEDSFDTHTARKAILSGVYDSLVYLQRFQHGNVFTHDPLPCNPYILQLFKVLLISSHTGGKKWNCVIYKG